MKAICTKFEFVATCLILVVLGIIISYNVKKERKEMIGKPDIGDSRVFHLYSQNGSRTEKTYPVECTGEAIEVINREADKQVNDESIDFNVFTLEVYTDHGEWEEYFDDEGRDIHELMGDDDDES